MQHRIQKEWKIKKQLITVFVQNMRNIVAFVQFASLLDKRVVVSPFSLVVWLLDSE